MANRKRTFNNKQSSNCSNVKRGNGRTYNNKGRSKSNDRVGEPTNTENDWAWYAPSEAIAKSVASIPYNVLTGLPTGVGALNDDGNNICFQYLPNVCVMRYINRIGSTASGLSGPNMAARQLYSFLRRNNSGARNYEAPDLMMYILAMEEIYSQYLECRRAYGVLQTYSFVNRALPKSLAIALEIATDDDEIAYYISQLATIRYRLNTIRLKINSLAVPKYFKSFQRRALLATVLLGDSTSIRSGIYAFNRSHYGFYDPTLYETGGAIAYRYKGIGLVNWLDQLEDMIERVISDDDMNTMMGDIIKAFGEGGLYSVPDVPENFVMAINYDENLLNQLHNTQFLTSFCDIEDVYQADLQGGAFNIWQADNLIKWEGMARVEIPQSSLIDSGEVRAHNAAVYHTGAMYLNSYKDDPNYLDTLEWTRNMFALERYGTDFTIRCGLELFIDMKFVFFTADGTTVSQSLNDFSLIPNLTGPGVTNFPAQFYAEQAIAISFLSNFDWHPIFWFADMTVHSIATPSGNYVTVRSPYYPIADFKVYTTVSAEALSRMHDNAVYAAYFDPSVLAGSIGG